MYWQTKILDTWKVIKLKFLRQKSVINVANAKNEEKSVFLWYIEHVVP